MATGNFAGFSAAFNDLLDRNRQDLNRLSGGQAVAKPMSTDSGMPSGQLDPNSATARTLNRDYGDGWQFSVVNWRRENDEIIVIGKLNIPERKLNIMQSAQVPIRISDTAGLAGSADGVQFAIEQNATATVYSDQEIALQEAIEQSAANCLPWL